MRIQREENDSLASGASDTAVEMRQPYWQGHVGCVEMMMGREGMMRREGKGNAVGDDECG